VKAQEINKRMFDEIRNQEILIGYCDRYGLTSEPFDEWFDMELNEYQLDYASLNEIDTHLPATVEITIVLGTWCSDSRREVPRFYKILDELNYNDDKLTVIGVDSDKQAPVIDFEELKIEKVPTFIFYKKGFEIGRIIETPEKTLEKDIIKILSDK